MTFYVSIQVAPTQRGIMRLYAACAFGLLALAQFAEGTPISVPNVRVRGIDNSTVPMPVVALGTAFGFDAAGRNETYTAVRTYLANGGRAVHAARMYCNQKEVGAAIRDSGIPREELFVMTMVPQWHMGYNESLASLQFSLDELGLSYVDLAMLHWPVMRTHDIPMYPVGDSRCGNDGQPACSPTVRVVLCNVERGEFVFQRTSVDRGKTPCTVDDTSACCGNGV